YEFADSERTLGAWDFLSGSGRDLSGHGSDAALHLGARVSLGLALQGNGYAAIENNGFLDSSREIFLEAEIQPHKIDGIRDIVAHGYTQAPSAEVFLRIHDGNYEAGSWNA